MDAYARQRHPMYRTPLELLYIGMSSGFHSLKSPASDTCRAVGAAMEKGTVVGTMFLLVDTVFHLNFFLFLKKRACDDCRGEGKKIIPTLRFRSPAGHVSESHDPVRTSQ